MGFCLNNIVGKINDTVSGMLIVEERDTTLEDGSSADCKAPNTGWTDIGGEFAPSIIMWLRRSISGEPLV